MQALLQLQAKTLGEKGAKSPFHKTLENYKQAFNKKLSIPPILNAVYLE